MADTLKNYRHALSGQLQRLTPRTASADKNLIEVADDAKPLAFTPIPAEAIEDYLASKTDDVADDSATETEEF